jgi:hypothetical protein
MPAALEAEEHRNWRTYYRQPRTTYLREQMSRRAGFVTYTAPISLLRENGLGIYCMHRWGGNYFALAQAHATGCYGQDGEFQVVDDFDDGVGAAIVARREVMGGDCPDRLLAEEDIRWDIYNRKEFLVARRREARK